MTQESSDIVSSRGLTLGVFAVGGASSARNAAVRRTVKALKWAVRLCYSLQRDAEFLFEAGAAGGLDEKVPGEA